MRQGTSAYQEVELESHLPVFTVRLRVIYVSPILYFTY